MSSVHNLRELVVRKGLDMMHFDGSNKCDYGRRCTDVKTCLLAFHQGGQPPDGIKGHVDILRQQ